MHLDCKLADTWVERALINVRTPYPFHLVHLCNDERDLRAPSELYPAFCGSYDWHSSVHMHWSIVRCLRAYPTLRNASEAWAHLEQRITPERIAGEMRYFEAPGRESFERPYGWGWLLALSAELERLARTEPRASSLRDAVLPLANLLTQRWLSFLPRLTYPVRAGTHGNTAFALRLTLDYARGLGDDTLLRAIEARAHAWFVEDRRYPASYEPSGDDFLSAGLCEASLMLHVLGEHDFVGFWQRFAPEDDGLRSWLEPVTVSDESDAKIVHLHGLNLSRAFCWRELAAALPEDLRERAQLAVDAHVRASLAAATSAHYVANHWLVSFALLAMGALDA